MKKKNNKLKQSEKQCCSIEMKSATENFSKNQQYKQQKVGKY